VDSLLNIELDETHKLALKNSVRVAVLNDQLDEADRQAFEDVSPRFSCEEAVRIGS
jgi:hypothetical protein